MQVTSPQVTFNKLIQIYSDCNRVFERGLIYMRRLKQIRTLNVKKMPTDNKIVQQVICMRHLRKSNLDFVFKNSINHFVTYHPQPIFRRKVS